MKKKLLKILGTILAVVAFFIAQYHIRQYYDIDPRIWFFVILGISFVGFVAIFVAFYSEIHSIEEYFNTHSFSQFISETSKKVKPITAKIKPIIEKIVNNFIYDLLSFITIMTAFTGVMYNLFFHDDFMARTTLYIVFLVMIVWSALSYIIRAIVIEGEKRSKAFLYSGMWTGIFLVHFLEFVFI